MPRKKGSPQKVSTGPRIAAVTTGSARFRAVGARRPAPGLAAVRLALIGAPGVTRANRSSAPGVSRRARAASRRPADVLPTPVHPVPLLRMAQDQLFQRGIVCPGRLLDLHAHVGGGDHTERFLEAQYVPSIRVAPA